MAGRTKALAGFRKIKKFQGKNTIINEHPVYENYKKNGLNEEMRKLSAPYTFSEERDGIVAFNQKGSMDNRKI